MYRKILVPLDGSARAECILPHVVELARVHQSRVVFLQVVAIPVLLDDYKQIQLEGTMAEHRRLAREADAYLERIAAGLRKKGLKVGTRAEHGPTVETIIRTAREEDVDLIAMASHGRGGLARVFYGSVAAGVLQAVDRPLLLIRSRKDA